VEWNYLLVDLHNRNLEQSNKLLQLAGLLTDSNVRIRRLQRFGAVSNDVPRMMELIVSSFSGTPRPIVTASCACHYCLAEGNKRGDAR